MIHKILPLFIILPLGLQSSFAQTSVKGMKVVTEEVTKEVTEVVKSAKKVETITFKPKTNRVLQAKVWPNPSNLGKVRLSVENLPEEPLFIQIFNNRDELIQEGVINGSRGATLHHILNLPDTSGTYSIKLSDATKMLKHLDLEIL